jgi:hypothetical protein
MKEIPKQEKPLTVKDKTIQYLTVLAATGVLYLFTCAPSLLWQDSGRIQYRVLHNDIEGDLGLALSHPLFYVLAIGTKYIPIGELAHRINMVSAIAAAVAVANLFLLLRLWLGKSLPALIGAITFALSHTFWRHASIAETYTLYIALFTAGLIMLLQYERTKRRRYLYWMALFNGLAIANHMFASIPLLCYIIFFGILLTRKEISFRHLAVAILLWIIGAGLYEYLIIKNIIQSGEFAGTIASAVFGDNYRAAVLNTTLSTRIVRDNLLFILLNFPTPNILMALAGFWGLSKLSPSRAFRNLLLGIMILFFLFAFRYTIVDRYAFFIPFYCMVSILIGLGSYVLQERINRKAFVYLVLIFSLMPIAVYAVTPTLAQKVHLSIGTKREIPYRNDYKYFLQPWRSGYQGAKQFAEEALEMVEEDAVIYADSTTVYPLLYFQEVTGRREDVRILPKHNESKDIPVFNEDTASDLINISALYVVSPLEGYCPAFLLEEYDFTREGVLYRVVDKDSSK